MSGLHFLYKHINGLRVMKEF